MNVDPNAHANIHNPYAFNWRREEVSGITTVVQN